MPANQKSAEDVVNELAALADPAYAGRLQRYFKTGTGEYGEGDVFLGIKVPAVRKVARRYAGLPLKEIGKLVRSEMHEHRMTALLILVGYYVKTDETGKERAVRFYLENTSRINNWDLVDITAPRIIGDYLFERPKGLLYRLAGSASLWERRIAIVSTSTFISKGEYDDALRLSEILLGDPHDLIHKAVGWMLREVGKREPGVAAEFLDRYCTAMPRTMLRYAIERLDSATRRRYMAR